MNLVHCEPVAEFAPYPIMSAVLPFRDDFLPRTLAPLNEKRLHVNGHRDRLWNACLTVGENGSAYHRRR